MHTTVFTAKMNFAAIACLMALLPGTPSAANEGNALDSAVAHDVGELAAYLAKLCPMADVANQAAFDSCRKGLFTGTRVQGALSPVTLWGRQRDPAALLKDSPMTQFAPEVLSGLYMPLFMFDGSYSVSYSEANGLYQAKLGVGFRNRLQPGQFPYPFWHDANKWATYENARTMLFWIDPKTRKARAVQFTQIGEGTPALAAQPASPPAFDGQWMWTDAQGKAQPTVTLFDGLFDDANPYKQDLEKSYRVLALSLRESQCLQCHVPNNPQRTPRLVLLQSPAHAAAEIKRLLKQVQSDRMPVDEFGLEESLDRGVKALLLERGREFERFVDMAHAWERQQHTSTSDGATVGNVQ